MRLGHRVSRLPQEPDGTVSAIGTRADGSPCREIAARCSIAADGMHSAVRAQMHPDQPPIHWGGAIMWRGTTPGVPIRTGASFVGLGTHRHRVVFYPISPPDPATGLATINWIAEVTVDNARAGPTATGTARSTVEEFVHHFEGWTSDWLDVPALLRRADVAYENPMIDRDPVPTWVDGRVALMGDAAHVMYPTGSNGASQAIVDARVLGAHCEHGAAPAALAAYDEGCAARISALVLRNRGAGPFGLLNLVDERCGGVFEDIDAGDPARGTRGLHGAVQAAAGLRHGEAERRAGDHRPGRPGARLNCSALPPGSPGVPSAAPALTAAAPTAAFDAEQTALSACL